MPSVGKEPATSVKIRATDKRRLDRLQAELTARRGQKVSQQELFSEILSLAEREKNRLQGWRPFSKTELSRLLELPVSTGDRRGEQQIDEDIYGGEV